MLPLLDHTYEYGAAPPVTVRLMNPFEPPKQATFVGAVVAESGANSSATDTGMVPEHELASVMVTVYAPAAIAVGSSMVKPLLHKNV